jgi:hypothetical protein
VVDRLSAEQVDEGVHASANRLDPIMPCGRDVPCQPVNHAAVLGKHGGNLFREDEVRAVHGLQPSGDGVVIGERDEGHPPCLRERVLLVRLCVALRAIDFYPNTTRR